MVSLYGQESVFTCSALEVKLFRLPFFFFNDTATTEIYTLSLHDALPISERGRPGKRPPHPPLVCLQLRERRPRSEEHTSELQSRLHLVCRLLLEKKNYTSIFKNSKIGNITAYVKEGYEIHRKPMGTVITV